MGRRRMFSHASQEADEALLNLTPLIDVVFVVLIIFILIAPMLELDRVELAAAAPKTTKEAAIVQEGSPIAIHVHADNTIWIQGRKILPEELVPILEKAKRAYPRQIPQLFHDRKAQFGVYQTIKNAVELSGFEELDVILQPG